MTIDARKNDNVMRTKRASRWRRVLFQRSTWAVSPRLFSHRRMLLLRDDRSIHSQKGGSAMALAGLLRNGLRIASWDILLSRVILALSPRTFLLQEVLIAAKNSSKVPEEAL